MPPDPVDLNDPVREAVDVLLLAPAVAVGPVLDEAAQGGAVDARLPGLEGPRSC